MTNITICLFVCLHFLAHCNSVMSVLIETGFLEINAASLRITEFIFQVYKTFNKSHLFYYDLILCKASRFHMGILSNKFHIVCSIKQY